MSIVLAISSQSKWLIAAIFLFLSLPVLLPLLFLCSFLVLMLLLPLGCALVGFLSWQRLRQPAAAPCPAPIRDEKQGNLLHFLLVNSGFVKYLLSFLLISQLGRLIEWVEKGKDECSDEEGSNWGKDKNDHNISKLPKRDGNENLDKLIGYGASEGDVLFWYNPLASIFDAEKQVLAEGAEKSELSTSDAESILSDYEEIAEVYQSKDLEELLSREECPDIDFEVESLNDNLFDDYSREAALTSTKLNVQGHEQSFLSDKQEFLSDQQDYFSDMLANVDQTALSNEEEEIWFQEMQLELEKYEMLRACDDVDNHHTKWIDWNDNDGQQAVDWISASDASHYAKNGGKRGKSSSISSLLSTGSGTISMTSTVCSTSSSSSTTWSAWSEESSSNLYGSSEKGWNDGRGRKGSNRTGGLGAGYNDGRPDHRLRVGGEAAAQQEAGQGKRMGIPAANRGKMGAAQTARASARVLGTAHFDGGRGCVKASKEEVGVELKGQGRKALCSAGEAVTYSQRGAATRARAVAGGRRTEEAAVKRVDETVGSNQYYIKKGNNNNNNSNNTARRSMRSAADAAAAAAPAAVRVNSTNTRQVIAPRRHVSGGQSHGSSTVRHVSNTRGHVTASEVRSGTGGSATSAVEDVRKRMMHVNNEVHAAPPYARIAGASDEYPQFYQLLEFWRGIERAFLQK